MNKTDKLPKLLFTAILSCLFQLPLSLADGSSRPDWQWTTSSRASLMQIAHALHLADRPIEQLLGSDQSEGRGTWVSAEKVFASVLTNLSMPDDFLVHGMYRREVEPPDPGAKTVVGKWGSSYNTWCMPSEKWNLAKEFWWYHDPKELPVGFPILWDKKPGLCGEVVPIVTIQLATDSVPVKKLDAYLKAARQWVEPRTQPVEEVLEMLRSDAVERRISGVRLLGARKDEKHMPAIADCFKDERMEVRRAAAWALGMVGGPEAISHLQSRAKDPSAGLRGEIASALGQIGGPATVEPLTKLLKDKDHDVRKNAAASMAATGSEKAIHYLVEALGDEDKATRQAALESLIQLGWRPPKQESSPSQ